MEKNLEKNISPYELELVLLLQYTSVILVVKLRQLRVEVALKIMKSLSDQPYQIVSYLPKLDIWFTRK